MNLPGDGVSVRGAVGATGFSARARSSQTRVVGLTTDPPTASRRFSIALDDGTSMSGVARVVSSSSVYIYGRRRPGTRVVVDGRRIAGAINDWDGMPPR